MPRSRSRSIESRNCSVISRLLSAPVRSSRRSESVVLPWSMWAMIEKLRIRCCMGARPWPRGPGQTPILRLLLLHEAGGEAPDADDEVDRHRDVALVQAEARNLVDTSGAEHSDEHVRDAQELCAALLRRGSALEAEVAGDRSGSQVHQVSTHPGTECARERRNRGSTYPECGLHRTGKLQEALQHVVLLVVITPAAGPSACRGAS